MAGWFSRRFDAWVARRAPRSSSITLNHSNILILPSGYGMIYLLSVVAIFICGANYANSLMLLLSYLLISLFFLAICYTYRNLSGLTVRSADVQNCFLGEQAMFTVNVMRPRSREYERITLKFKQSSAETTDLIDHREANVEILVEAHARGYLRPGRLKIETIFPLGIVRSWSWLDLDQVALVYPKPKKNQYVLETKPRDQEGPVINPNGSEDFYGLRNYAPGDPIARCYWKTLARGMALSTKIFVNQVDQTLTLDLEQMPGSHLELRLSYICYWVLRCSEQNRVYSLQLGDYYLPASEGHSHRLKALRQLALYGLAKVQQDADTQVTP